MLTIFIDNKPHQVREDQNLLQACLTLGFDLPYFCWHPALHSVGACRQCAVKAFKDEKDTRGRIVMSCMTSVSEGLRISIDDAEARAFRSSVIEWLMLNHPHDCPVCDEGGECHLQDMTVMTGHNYRRTRFKKRTHRNQDLGPFINHEMNRCIACYRCVRFYRNHAGGRDLNVFGAHDHVYFGRAENGALESEFSGNLVEVCPTGVFTDKTLKRHYTRKWDLQTAPSICVHCGLGCNTIAGERYGTLRRILNRYHHEINGYFLCDRGRFGYEFVNSGKRIRKPLLKAPSPTPLLGGKDIRREGHESSKPISKKSALKQITDILSNTKKPIGIGSPRASLESNFALRTLVGPDNFYSGMSSRDHQLVALITTILLNGPARIPSILDIEQADAILILGEDLTNTAPLLDLAVRQSVKNKPEETAAKMRIPAWDANATINATQNEMGPLYIAWTSSTKLDAIATKTFHAGPHDIAGLGFALAHELNPNAPAVPPLPAGERTEVRGGSHVPPLISEIAAALKSAKRPVIISGTSLGSEHVIQAAANIAWALCDSGTTASLCYTVPECNSMGLGLMNAKNIQELDMMTVETVIILENDLYRRIDHKAVDAFLNNAKHVIVIDHLINPTSLRADIVLPAATFAESNGTVVNNEGRAQRHYQVFNPDLDIQAGWKWINDILISTGNHAIGKQPSYDNLISGIAAALPIFAPIKDLAPAADFRINGLKIPRQPQRYSGRTSIHADITLHEPKPPEDIDSPLSFSMEGSAEQPPAPLISRYWSAGWNSVQALNKFQQEVGGPLKGGDPGKRLIEPAARRSTLFFMGMPSNEQHELSEQDFPRFRIFGSEELSMYAPAIIERAKQTLDGKTNE